MQPVDTLIEISPGEVRAALVDGDGGLRRLRIERFHRPTLIGAVFRARVSRVEPAMQAAFLDLGAGGEAFLPRAKGLTEGRWVIVQITRDAHDGKGPAATLRPVLVDRYLSYAPQGEGVSYDRALGQGRDRARVEKAVEGLAPLLKQAGGGLTVRAPAVAVGERELHGALERLVGRWRAVETAAKQAKGPALLESAPDLVARLVRDAPPAGRIAVDDRLVFGGLQKTLAAEAPDLAPGLTFHDGPAPLFEAAGVAEQIDEALSRRVVLPGGGELVFDRTEALTAIDVNLGEGAAGLKGGDAALRLNLRAAEVVAHQILLRNLAGLIVVDFLTMKKQADRKRLVEALRRGLRHSGALTDVLGVTAAGLVEITRQRSGPSLGEIVLDDARPVEPEPAPDSEACRLLREVLRLRGAGRPVIYAGERVCAAVDGPLAAARAETERRLGQALTLVPRAGRPEVRLERRPAHSDVIADED